MCTPLIANWSAGSSIKCRVYNANNNSGWINMNQVGTFNAFSSQPTKMQVALITNGSNTTGIPAVYGIAIAELDN